MAPEAGAVGGDRRGQDRRGEGGGRPGATALLRQVPRAERRDGDQGGEDQRRGKRHGYAVGGPVNGVWTSSVVPPLTTVTVTRSPLCLPLTACAMLADPETWWPSTSTIVSPGVRPARSPAPPGVTASITAAPLGMVRISIPSQFTGCGATVGVVVVELEVVDGVAGVGVVGVGIAGLGIVRLGLVWPGPV